MNNHYLGRRQLGQEIEFRVSCTNTAGAQVAPDTAPEIRIYNSSGTRILTRTIPTQDHPAATGVFMLPQLLDGNFFAGRYYARTTWTAGAFSGVQLDVFEVVPGGDPDGQIISMTWTTLPHFRHLIYETDTGQYFKGGNPSLQ